MGFFDYTFNVVRNVYDLLHILTYVFIVLIFLLLSIYRFDKKLYTNRIYLPLVNLLKSQYYYFTKNFFKKLIRLLIMILKIYAPTTLRLASNRLPYYVISLRVKIKLVKAIIKNIKKKITNFFKKK